jgi:SP family general alpha glucoside:H+ symporter-like MFS transporter
MKNFSDEPAAVHVEEHGPTKLPSVEEAKRASDAEHAMGFRQAFSEYRKAVMWSAVISLSIIMEGYDTGLMPQFFGYPAFQKRYGTFTEASGYQVSGPWQVGLINASNAGVVIGGFLNGFFAARYGYKLVMLVSLFLMNCFIFITFFAPSLAVLCTGQVLCGLTWGVFATTGPAYASEICPLALRGYLTAYVNLCWATGQFISSGVLFGLLKLDSQWSYRIPFAIQWAWPLPLFLIILWAPESPWWLVRKDRIDDAAVSLRRISNKDGQQINESVAMIMHTIRIENEIESGASYLNCFKGIDLRRTEICCLTFAGQMLAGAQFAYGPTYFFEQAGISVNDAYKIGFGDTGIAFLGTVLSWFLMTWFGRRTLYLAGIATLTVTLLLVGIISVSSQTSGATWTQAVFTLLWLFVYSMTVGPVCYAIISETSSVRLRAKTVALSRNTYNITAIICAILEPYMINPTEWNWKGKTAFFWCGTAAVTTVWTYFRLPECRGRTYEELDLMFAQGVSAWKFRDYKIDAYADELGPSTTAEGEDHSAKKE